jgi:hypothetical protein
MLLYIFYPVRKIEMGLGGGRWVRDARKYSLFLWFIYLIYDLFFPLHPPSSWGYLLWRIRNNDRFQPPTLTLLYRPSSFAPSVCCVSFGLSPPADPATCVSRHSGDGLIHRTQSRKENADRTNMCQALNALHALSNTACLYDYSQTIQILCL